jgi:glycosyltransferase involved in cell wall biosynthesis
MKRIAVSIIICTRNRVESLRETLDAIDRCDTPEDTSAELIVVDNGSTDGTPKLLASLRFRRPLKIVSEPRAGQCRAYNRAVTIASGDALLFTDDDVRPPHDWIVRMTEPIRLGIADAVAGGVRMSVDLHRPWIAVDHQSWLACNDHIAAGSVPCLVGANMAIARHVFDKVPQFDPEMGPGAIGHASDTLFSVQVQAAGFRIVSAYDVVVEHCFDAARLSRSAFEHQARKRGEFNAYIAHHWFHAHWRFARVKAVREWCKLQWARLRHLREWTVHPSCPEWELGLMEGYQTFRQYVRERRRPRNYEKQGLVKRSVLETK